MITYYRIVDIQTNEIVANSIPTANQAQEVMHFYCRDYPKNKFVVEEYQQSSVKSGFGRDSDLH